MEEITVEILTDAKSDPEGATVQILKRNDRRWGQVSQNYSNLTIFDMNYQFL